VIYSGVLSERVRNVTPDARLRAQLGDGSDLLRVEPDDPAYLATAAAEARYWQAVHPFSLEAVHPAYADGPVDRYLNRKFTGNEKLSWPSRIRQLGTFRRGLMLGAMSLPFETHVLETNPTLHLTLVDISDGPLARRVEALGPRFRDRLSTLTADLNFIALEPERYDLIISSSTIHHVTNLEYLAHQINRALTADGFFLLEDYVGEPRFGFSDEKKRLYEVVYNRDLARQGDRRPGLIWQDDSDLSPFCGVRSNEILTVMPQFLDVVELHTAATLVTPMMRSRPVDDRTPKGEWTADNWKPLGRRRQWIVEKLREKYPRLLGKRRSHQSLIPQEFLDELFLLGDVLTEAGILLPCVAFGRFRKRRAS
jgi:SAM-dependent methyltransferase